MMGSVWLRPSGFTADSIDIDPDSNTVLHIPISDSFPTAPRVNLIARYSVHLFIEVHGKIWLEESITGKNVEHSIYF